MERDELNRIIMELEEGIGLPRCRGCACLKESLELFALLLSKLDLEHQPALAESVVEWLRTMQKLEEPDLNCHSCPPAETQKRIRHLLDRSES